MWAAVDEARMLPEVPRRLRAVKQISHLAMEWMRVFAALVRLNQE